MISISAKSSFPPLVSQSCLVLVLLLNQGDCHFSFPFPVPSFPPYHCPSLFPLPYPYSSHFHFCSLLLLIFLHNPLFFYFQETVVSSPSPSPNAPWRRLASVLPVLSFSAAAQVIASSVVSVLSNASSPCTLVPYFTLATLTSICVLLLQLLPPPSPRPQCSLLPPTLHLQHQLPLLQEVKQNAGGTGYLPTINFHIQVIVTKLVKLYNHFQNG